MEIKSFNVEIKANEDGLFEGYGAYFGNIDSYRDIIEKGAFSRTLKNNMKRIKILWQHDRYEPIGKPIEMFEDDKGLFLKAKICMTDTGKKCYELMKEGIINELSIGFDTVIDEYNKDKDIRYLKEIKLYEVSAVTWAANPKATVSNVKSFDEFIEDIKNGKLDIDKIDELIKVLKALQGKSEPEKSTQIIENPPECIKSIDPENLHSILELTKQYI